MTEHEKLLALIMRGSSDANVEFNAIRKLMRTLGFTERIRGSHQIFAKDGVEEILNPQPRAGGKAKPYQVRQIRQIIIKYRLGGEE
jgi:predicted RNA binding protein YcfA (HicA-like mRNA interferase family)